MELGHRSITNLVRGFIEFIFFPLLCNIVQRFRNISPKKKKNGMKREREREREREVVGRK